jgi:putative transposase
MPPKDADFSRRWMTIKRHFSAGLPADTSRSESKINKREKGIWQRRFWEHQVRDEADWARCIEYTHYNPVKHGWAKQVIDWPHSSFHRYVREGIISPDWGSQQPEAETSPFGE